MSVGEPPESGFEESEDPGQVSKEGRPRVYEWRNIRYLLMAAATGAMLIGRDVAATVLAIVAEIGEMFFGPRR